MALVCGYGSINPQPWMVSEPLPMPQSMSGGGIIGMDEKLVMNPGALGAMDAGAGSSRSYAPAPELGQFGSDQCRNPGCKCHVLKTKSSYGYVRHVRRSHGLPTSVARRMCVYGNIHVDARFTKPLSVDTGTEYELPKHLYPPLRSDPILMIHPSYKRYLGIKQRFLGPSPCNATAPMGATVPNFQWSDQIKRCGSAQRQCVETNPSTSSHQSFAPPQYVPKTQAHPQQMVSHMRQASLPVSIDVTRTTYTRVEPRNTNEMSGMNPPSLYRSGSTDHAASLAAFVPTCADLGIPVSQPQPQFKVPVMPNAAVMSKRPKQDFQSISTSQFQPVFTHGSLPPPYWSTNKENTTMQTLPPPPYFVQPSTSAAVSTTTTMSSLDHLNARDMFFQHARVEGTPASMKMLPGTTFPGNGSHGMGYSVAGASTSTSGSTMQMSMSSYASLPADQRPTYSVSSFQHPHSSQVLQQQIPMPPPPPYYVGVKFAHPAPPVMPMLGVSEASSSVAASFPASVYSNIPSRSVAQTMLTSVTGPAPQTSGYTALHNAHHHHAAMTSSTASTPSVTTRSVQDASCSLQVPREFAASGVDGQLMQSTEMMMASMAEFPTTNVDDSAMRSARRLPKSGKTRAMRFHSFHGDRES